MSRFSFQGRTASLATKHDKLKIFAPAIEPALGINIFLAEIDTDQFGTFAGDIPRLESPLDTAIAKARAGMRALATGLGFASEGTISPDPVSGMFVRDIEIAVLVDDVNDQVICGQAVSHEIVTGRHYVTPKTDLASILINLDVPRHSVMVMAECSPQFAVKGLRNQREIIEAVRTACNQSADGQAVITADLRAQCSPSRQLVIEEAVANLVKRTLRHCPTCDRPGWGQIDWLWGRTCSGCGNEVSELVRGRVDGCQMCGERVSIELQVDPVDPGRCPQCNP